MTLMLWHACEANSDWPFRLVFPGIRYYSTSGDFERRNLAIENVYHAHGAAVGLYIVGIAGKGTRRPRRGAEIILSFSHCGVRLRKLTSAVRRRRE